MTKGKITVAQIVSGLSIGGGVEWVVYNIIKNLDCKIFNPIVLILSGDKKLDTDQILATRLKKIGFSIYFFNTISSPNPKYIVRNLLETLKLSQFLRVNRVDIVQTHEFFAGTLGRLAAIIAKVPVIILMVHNCDLWKNRLHQTVDRLLANYTDAIISNSKSVMDFYIQFESINPAKIKTIYNGIDLSRFHHLINTDGKIKELNIEENYPIICVTGRMADQKGYKYLIKAIPQVIKEFPQMKMLIIGGGGVSSETTEEEIKDLVKRLYLKKFVHFLGWRADVTEILAICDLFVLPSLWEGFGLSIVEAMAAGKPVVATNVDAIPEVVSDGETGILVPPKDPNALANAIITLLEDPEKMRKMGQSGKKRAFDLFSAKRMTKDFEKLYLSLYNKNNMLIT